jgi:hypothetical protein
MGETREQFAWPMPINLVRGGISPFGRRPWDTQRSQVNKSPEPSANNALNKDGT